MGGGRSPQNPKKKLNFGGDTHVTLNPKPKKKIAIGSKCPCNPKTPNLQYLPNPTLLDKNNSTNSFKTLENGGGGGGRSLKKFKHI